MEELSTNVSDNHTAQMDGILYQSKLRKIPIIITKYNDNNIKGWRAEIADNYDNYKPDKYDNINFEDLDFHFNHEIETHDKDNLVFNRRKDAVACAKFVNKKYLSGKAKIWFL